MGRAVFLLLLSSVVFLGGGPKAQEFPDPQTLLSASRAAYQALRSYTALVTMAIESPFFTELTTLKVLFFFPFSRTEYVEGQRDEYVPQPVLQIVDHQEGRSFVFYTNEVWEEILDESLKGAVRLDEILFAYSEFDYLGIPEKVERGEFRGKPAWVIKGPKITIWLEEETLFVRRIESQIFGITISFTVEEVKLDAEIPSDLFQPPPPELVARRITVIPRGREILRSVWEKLSGLETFIVRKRVTTTFGQDEKVVIYRHPFLRVETHTLESPFFPSQLLSVTIRDFAGGLLYFYNPTEDSWEKVEVDVLTLPEDTLMFALAEAFCLLPPELVTVVGLKEESLRGRETWRITARGMPGTDDPGPEWWVDQETLSVLRYAEPIRFREPREKEFRWVIERGDILSFEPNPEIPDEVFAVPQDVPVRRLELPEEPWFEEEEEEATLEGWEPYSLAKLEEAKAQKKNVVLYFAADWCEPCHALAAGPLRNPQVQELLSPLVRLVVDLTRPGGEAKKVADLYKVRALPTLLFLDAQGNELGRISGYRSTSSLLREIKKILEGSEK